MADFGSSTAAAGVHFLPVFMIVAAPPTKGCRDAVRDMFSLTLAHLNSATKLEIGSTMRAAEALWQSEPLPPLRVHQPLQTTDMR